MKTHFLRGSALGLFLSLVASTLPAAETAVIKASVVNVRGQPSVTSEVITQLKAGDSVTILEEIALTKSKTNEPIKWLRIQMPSAVKVWVHSDFINPAGHTVKPARLNLRSGPGENFSVVGVLEREATVKVVRTAEHWMEIEAPTNAFAYVAANLVSASPAVAKAATTKTEKETSSPAPAKTITGVMSDAQIQPLVTNAVPSSALATPKSETPTMQPPTSILDSLVTNTAAATQTTAPPNATNPPAALNATISSTTATEAPKPVAKDTTTLKAEPPVAPPIEAAPPSSSSPPKLVPLNAPPSEVALAPAALPPVASESAKTEEPAPRRLVQREGLVWHTTSPITPTASQLLDPKSYKPLNFIYTTATNINLKHYRGRTVIVTGEEAMDPNWKYTPVLKVEKIELISNAKR